MMVAILRTADVIGSGMTVLRRGKGPRSSGRRRGGAGIPAVALLCMAVAGHAQTPERTHPDARQDLLSRFAGDWDVTGEVIVPLDGQRFRVRGTESARMLGEFWLIGEIELSMAGVDMSGLMQIGYDPAGDAFVGSYVSSLGSFHWKYTGQMDDAGTKLTLETEGPSPLHPGETAWYRETLELRDDDHKRFTSFMQDHDGKWVRLLTWDYRRKR